MNKIDPVTLSSVVSDIPDESSSASVGSLLRLFTVAVVPTLLDAVSLWMTASF